MPETTDPIQTQTRCRSLLGRHRRQRLPVGETCGPRPWHGRANCPRRAPPCIAPGRLLHSCAQDMHDRHPAPRTEDGPAGTGLLPLATLPSISLMQEAMLSVALDSAGGSSGLRPQHIKRGLIPGYKEELLQAFHVWSASFPQTRSSAAPSLGAPALRSRRRKKRANTAWWRWEKL